MSDNGRLTVIAAQNGVGKTTLMDAFHIALYGLKGFQIRHNKRNFHDWLRSAYSVESDGSENIQFSIDILDPIMGLVKLSRTYWLVPEDEGGIEEEVVITVEGKPLEKEGNESRNNLCERWIEDYLPTAAVRRNLVDGERLSDLDPRRIDDEIISGIDDITGIGLLHKMSKRLISVRRKTLRTLAPDDQKENLDALLKVLISTKEDTQKNNLQLGENEKELTEIQFQITKIQEEIESITRTDGVGNVQLRMDYAIKNSELTSSRKDINDQIQNSLPFVIAGFPSDLSEWNLDDIIESKRENERMQQHLEFLKLVLEKSSINDRTKEKIVGKADELVVLQHYKNLNPISSLPLALIESIQQRHISLAISEGMVNATRTLEEALDKLNEFENVEAELRAASFGLGISDKANKLKELSQTVGLLQADSASLRGKIKKLDEDKKTIELRIDEIKQNEDSDSLLNRRMIRIDQLESLIELVKSSVRNEFSIPLAESFKEGFELLSRKSGRLEDVKIDTKEYSTHLSMRGFSGNWLDRDLSATEKQHVGLALLYALCKASISSKYGLSLPVVIDTPTSRMDMEHKSWSVTRFYPNLSNQVIVFATSDDLANGLYDELKESEVLGLQLLIEETTENSVQVSNKKLDLFFGGNTNA